MRPVLYLMLIMILSAFNSFSETVDTASEKADSSLTSQSDTTVSIDSIVDGKENTAIQLCTLAITTDPPEATIQLDGETFGVSPLTIVDVDTGKHVLILKKSGFYQKKVVITLDERKTTQLHFSLTAPGSLSIISVPSGAILNLNGKNVGTTPLTDSLVKPGTYQVTLSARDYDMITESVRVKQGQKTVFSDTLRHTATFLDSVHRSDAVSAKKSRKTHTIVVAGFFGLFLLILAIIEARE